MDCVPSSSGSRLSSAAINLGVDGAPSLHQRDQASQLPSHRGVNTTITDEGIVRRVYLMTVGICVKLACAKHLTPDTASMYTRQQLKHFNDWMQN